MSFFENIEMAPVDPILGITAAFNSDPRSHKINLGVGTYKAADLKPFILPSVIQAEAKLLEQNLTKEYLPINGDRSFLEMTRELVFEKSVLPAKIFAAQTIGGTGSLRVGADFLCKEVTQEIFIPAPTWDNHQRIFTHAGFHVQNYPYYDAITCSFNLKGMLQAIDQMPPSSVILLHASCHNPTGFDPTKEQWEEIRLKVASKRVIPFFDFAYQGFGEGLEEDAWPVRSFAKAGMDLLVSTSYSKNFGLYAERIGALFVLGADESVISKIESQIKVIIRGLYSNPSCHGAQLVSLILQDPHLRPLWESEVVAMRKRIETMRKALAFALKNEEYQVMLKQKGMFSYTGLNASEVEKLIQEYAIYLPKDGRINVAGLNLENVERVAQAIREVHG